MMKISELNAKLENITQSHSKTCEQLHTLLTQQNQLSNQWKQESSTQKNHFDTLLQEYTTKNSRLFEKIQEYEANQAHVDELVQNCKQQVFDEKKITAKYYAALMDSEKRCEEYLARVQGFLSRESELLNEKKRMRKFFYFIYQLTVP